MTLHLKESTLALALALALVLVLVLLAASGALSAAEITNNNITEAEVKAAQDGWGAALIKISDDYRAGGIECAKAAAESVLDSTYGYQQGAVLFKPPLAGGEQTFGTTREEALAYCVGNSSAYPTDKGFALKNWQSYRYDNAAVYINGDMALTMGKVHLVDRDNKETTLDKTWGFKKGEDGKVRIVLHHSSVPYPLNCAVTLWVCAPATRPTKRPATLAGRLVIDISAVDGE